MSSSPQYTGYFSPTYDVQLTDDTGAVINLTGVDHTTGLTLIMLNPNTGEFQHGIGAWTITDAANGKASYQWTPGDLAVPGLFVVYVTVQLPDEPSPRAFDPDKVFIVALEKGNAAVSTQDINILQVNGAQVSSANPVPISGPVQMADGANVTQGSKGDAAITDPTVSASEIALLKGLVKILALQSIAITGVDGAIASLGSIGDAAWSGSGNGTGIAILKKIEALLAATQTIAGNVGVTNFPSIQRVDAQSGDFPAGSIVDLATLAGIVSGGKASIQQADLNTTGVINAAQPLIGTPVTNASVALALGQGQSSWKAQLLAGGGGFTSATTIVADGSPDGGTTWYTKSFKVSGATTPASSVAGPGPIELSGNASGLTHVRIRCSVLNSTETINVTLRASAGVGDIGILSPLPAGSNLVGGIKVVDSGGSNKQSINSAGQAQVEDIEQANYIALTSPPSTTNAGSDTALTFSSQVNRAIIQNNTSANVNYAFDTAASAGSLMLVPGTTLIYPKKCTVLHLYTAAVQNINGTSSGNIVVLGAL